MITAEDTQENCEKDGNGQVDAAEDKPVWADDNSAVADMSGVGRRFVRKKTNRDRVELTKHERRAIRKAGYIVGLKVMAVALIGMGLLFGLMYLWLL